MLQNLVLIISLTNNVAKLKAWDFFQPRENPISG